MRHAARLTRYALKADGQTSFFKLMSKITTVRSRNSPNWFGFVFLPSNRSWQNGGEKFTRLESRSRSDILGIRGSTHSDRAIRRKTRDEQWNSESVKAVLVSPWELRVRTELHAPLTRQKYITNQMLDKHGPTPLCTRCSLGTGSHSSDCRARFDSIWTKKLAEAEVPIRAEAEVAHCAADEVPIDPNVSVSEPAGPAAAAGGQPFDGGKHRSSCCKGWRGSVPAGRESSTTHGGVAGTTRHWSETYSRNTIDAEQC